MASSSSNVVGVHYRVGKKIGEGSFGVIFEGTNLLNNQQVAIKFVCLIPNSVKTMPVPLYVQWHRRVTLRSYAYSSSSFRSPERAMHLSCEMSTEHIKSLLVAVRMPNLSIESAELT